MKRKLWVLLSALLLTCSLLIGCEELAGTDPLQTTAVLELAESAAAKETTSARESTAERAAVETTRALSEAEGQERILLETEALLSENGSYNSKEEVALYIYQYGKLPGNYITKKKAQELGWTGGSLEPYAPGKSIGGSRFGNYEGLLPEAKGRTYYECDIDTMGKKSRGAKRIVYSTDGLIYYTEDHYETFELLYGEE